MSKDSSTQQRATRQHHTIPLPIALPCHRLWKKVSPVNRISLNYMDSSISFIIGSIWQSILSKALNNALLAVPSSSALSI